MTARPFLSSLLPDALTAEDGGDVLMPPQRRLGDILREVRLLSDAQIDGIVAHQRAHRLRFGQAAAAMRLVSKSDVAWALSQQFQYTWLRSGRLHAQPDLVMALQPFSARAEAVRDLRARLMADRQLDRRPVAVVSAAARDGRSALAANLAIAFSQMGANTLLIDADLRHPRQHRLFDLAGAQGLSTLLAERGARSVVRRVAELPNLHLLPAGLVPPNPLELLQRGALAALLKEVAAAFDYVVVDTPAAQRSADARVVAACCGAAVMVGRQGHSKLAAMRELADATGTAGVHLAGVVVNTA